MSIEAMKLALEALEAVSKEMTVGERYTNAGQQVLDAIDHLRVATTQQPATRLPEDVVIGHVTLCKGSNISLLIEYAKRLNADVERLEAQQPATSEPVGYMNEGHIHELAMRRLPYGYVYPEAGAGASTAVYTRPAPSVPDDVARDAERYRWLRDNGVLGFSGAPSWRVSVSFDAMDAYAQTLDSNIDAAMLAT